jgi:hypothetical protein
VRLALNLVVGKPMNSFVKVICVCVISLLNSPVLANPTWLDLSAKNQDATSIQNIANKGRLFSINQTQLQQHFQASDGEVLIEIPLPSGLIASYKMKLTASMAPALAQKYPQLLSYVGSDINDLNNTGRFNFSPGGLSGMFVHDKKWIFLSPLAAVDNNVHISYYRDDAKATAETKHRNDLLLLPRSLRETPELAAKLQARESGDEIRTYRLALTASGEYTSALGGVAAAMAELNTLVNRVNGILLTDLSIQFELIANNDQLIFSNSSIDPFTNSDAEADLEANQELLDDTIGSDNYDLGHLLNTNGGGLAFVGVVCREDFKGQGYTGSNNPRGERFYIDLVLHELGHQLGASHSFNAIDSGSCTAGSDGQRSSEKSVEPGGGTTIMSYSGICAPQNVQNNSDPYFHATSITEIRDYVDNSIDRSCGTTINPNNAIPQITLDTSRKTIPANTPFLLTASATDADGDTLTYAWDQIDAGGESGGTSDQFELAKDNGSNPLFRSREPTENNTRFLPRLSDVLRDRVVTGEVYPSTNRELNFEVVVRDNRGGVNTEKVALDVLTMADDFSVSQPATAVVWEGNSIQFVEWQRADTHLPPISCSFVDISIDIDGDNDFNTQVANSVANTGSALITVPNSAATIARLMVKCSDNHFYAINPGSFFIEANTASTAPVITGQQPITISEDSSVTLDFSQIIVDDPDSSYPDGFSLTVNNGSNYSVSGRTVTPVANFNGMLSVNVFVDDGSEQSNIFALSIDVLAVNDAPLITAQSTVNLNEDSSLNLSLDLLSVSDPDSNFPDDFSLSVNNGDNYSTDGTSITPLQDYNGPLVINLSVSDETNQSANFALAATVNALNDAPAAENDQATISTNSSSNSLDILANDSDVDGDTLSLADFVYSGSGAMEQNGNLLEYTPAAGFSGTETTTYTISDGQGLTASATLTLTVATAVTPTPTPTPTPTSSGGGGSMNWWMYLILLSATVTKFRCTKLNRTKLRYDYA